MITKKNTNIEEIRVEEVHDHEQGKHFFRVYFYYAELKKLDSHIKKIISACNNSLKIVG